MPPEKLRKLIECPAMSGYVRRETTSARCPHNNNNNNYYYYYYYYNYNNNNNMYLKSSIKQVQ